MSTKRAFSISLLFHLGLLIVLSLGGGWWKSSAKRPPLALEANLLYRESIDKKDLLPKKNAKKAPAKKDVVEKKVKPKEEIKAAKAPEPPAPSLAPVTSKKAVKSEGKIAVAKGQDFSKKLSQLSRDFAAELNTQKKPAKVEEVVEQAADDNYFAHVYSLIKESFVVPPHINGPRGKNLSAVLRIFLSRDGTLTKLDLEKASGDAQFDKAVQEGTLRVNNFGRVPILLQGAMQERGIVVELCPFKCAGEQ